MSEVGQKKKVNSLRSDLENIEVTILKPKRRTKSRRVHIANPILLLESLTKNEQFRSKVTKGQLIELQPLWKIFFYGGLAEM